MGANKNHTRDQVWFQRRLWAICFCSGLFLLSQTVLNEPGHALEKEKTPTSSGGTPGTQKSLSEKNLAKLWDQLGDADPRQAYAAFESLLSHPEQMVGFFQKQIKVVPARLPVDAKHVAQLIQELDHKQYAVRANAFQELQELGFAAKSALEKAQQAPASQEAGVRLELLLKRLAHCFPARVATKSARQQWRAIVILEHMGTKPAKRLLKELAQGKPGHWQTRQARAALNRLEPQEIDLPREKDIRIHQWKAHTKTVSDLAFHPTGRILASGSYDGTLKLWDLKTQKELASLNAHKYVFSVCFSPDGNLLATAEYGGLLRLRELCTGGELAVIHTDTQAVNAVAFHPKGRILALENRDTIKLWDVFAGKLITHLTGFNQSSSEIRHLMFSPDGTQMGATAYNDKTVRLWDMASQSQKQVFAVKKGQSPQFIHFDPDGKKTLISTSDEGRKVQVWDIDSGKFRLEIETRQTYLSYKMAIHPGGELLAIAGMNGGRIKLLKLNVDFTTTLAVRNGPEGAERCVVFDPKGCYMAVADTAGNIQLWDLTGSPAGKK